MPVVHLTAPDPNGDPHAGFIPRESGGRNEFVYQFGGAVEGIGKWALIDIPAGATIDKGDDPMEIAWNTDWTLSPGLPNPGTRVIPNHVGGGNVHAACLGTYLETDYYTCALTYLTLPESNDILGDRTVTLSTEGYVEATEPTTANIQVFFNPVDDSHPAAGDPGGCTYFYGSMVNDPSPNWLYYYGQVPGILENAGYSDPDYPLPPGIAWPGRSAIKYGITNHPDWYGWWWDDNTSWWESHRDHIHITDLLMSDGYATFSLYKANAQGELEGATYLATGIDAFAAIVIHEVTHMAIYNASHDPSNADWYIGSTAHSDNDNIPDWVELKWHLDPNSPTTVGINDQEVMCDMAVWLLGAHGDYQKDWASSAGMFEGGWMWNTDEDDLHVTTWCVRMGICLLSEHHHYVPPNPP